MTREEFPTQGLVSLGLVSLNEFHAIWSALWERRQGLTTGIDPLVKCEGGRRRWQLANDDLIINIEGGSAQFEGTYALSAEFMLNCYSLARLDGEIEITIDGKSVIAISPIGTITMTGRQVNSEFRSINQLRPVEARVTAVSLLRNVHMCTNFPTDTIDVDLRHVHRLPATTITIGDNTVACSSERNAYGLENVLTTTPAVTSGRGVISVSSMLLCQKIETIGLSRNNPEITITFDPLGGDFIEFSTNSIYIALRRTLVGADAAIEKIRATLKGRMITHAVSDNGTIAADIDGVLVRIALVEGEQDAPAIARCTSIVLKDATEGSALLEEINACNKVLADSRVWYDGGRVVIGCDVYSSEISNFETHFDNLIKDARKLQDVLAPLGAKPYLT